QDLEQARHTFAGSTQRINIDFEGKIHKTRRLRRRAVIRQSKRFGCPRERHFQSHRKSVASSPECAKSRSEPRDSTEKVRRGASEDTTKQSGRTAALEMALFLADRDENFPITVGLHRGNKARALHLLDQARGAVVADAQMT